MTLAKHHACLLPGVFSSVLKVCIQCAQGSIVTTLRCAHTRYFMTVKWHFSRRTPALFFLPPHLYFASFCELDCAEVGGETQWGQCHTDQETRCNFSVKVSFTPTFLSSAANGCLRGPGQKLCFPSDWTVGAVCRILSCFKKRGKREVMWSVTTGSRRGVSSCSAETFRDLTCKLHCFSVHSFFSELCHKQIIPTSNSRAILCTSSYLNAFFVISFLHLVTI